jgi:hypothetical protein
VNSDDRFQVVLYSVALLFIFGIMAARGCTEPDQRVRDVLERAGYTPVRVGGYDFGACSGHDATATHFVAKGAHGDVEGTVCCGWFKSCTIRW